MKARFIAIFLSLIAATISVYADSPSSQPKQVPKTTSSSSARIDLNAANVDQLTGSYKGIGKKRAEAIIAYREAHRGFKSIEELAEVKGLGQHFLDKNREGLNNVFIVNK